MWLVNRLDRKVQVNGLEQDNWSEKNYEGLIKKYKCTKIAHVRKKEILWSIVPS